MLSVEKACSSHNSNYLIRVLFLFLVVLITSCAHEPIEPYVAGRAKPQLQMDSVIEVLDFSPERISAVADSQQRVHMLAADEKNGVVYLILGRDGVKYRETVVSTWKEGVLQIAIDVQGIVHAIIGDEHFIRQNEKWRAVEKVRCQRLIRAGDSLACAFIVTGKEVNAPGKWDLYLFGSQYPALILPFAWYSHPNKVVLTFWKAGTWSRWTVIDPDQPTLAGDSFALAVDARNNVDILFMSPLGQEGTIDSSSFRLMYAQVPSEARAIADTQRAVAADSKQAGKEFIPVSSHPIEIAETQRQCSGVPVSLMFAGNPTTQENLAVICHFLNNNLNWTSFELNRGEVYNTQTLLPQPDYGLMKLKVFTTVPWAWLPSGLTFVGDGTWVMTVARNDLPGLYLMTYQRDRWSSIEPLTGFDVAKSICFWAVYPQIISIGRGEAVAIWHESTGGLWSGHCEGKLMMRWIKFAT